MSTQVTTIERAWSLRGTFRLFLEGLDDPQDEQAILKALEGHPLHVALTEKEPELQLGSTVFALVTTTFKGLRIRKGYRQHKGQKFPGLIIELESDMARLTAALLAIESGMGYSLSRLKEKLAEDVELRIARIIERFGLNGRFEGIQLHASTAPGVPEGMAIMHPNTARAWAEVLLPKHGDTDGDVKSLHGLRILVHREPVAGHANLRWVTLLVQDDVQEGHLILNAGDWNWLNGGDSDGDIVYAFVLDTLEFVSATRVRAYPPATLLDGSPVLEELVTAFRGKPQDLESIRDRAVQQVMAALLKDLTGPMDYVFHCLAHAAGFNYTHELLRAEERVEAKGKVTRATFRVYFPLQEQVMDGRKQEGGLGALFSLGDTVRNTMTGKTLAVEPFLPFLNGDAVLEAKFREVVRIAGGNLKACRRTAYGTMIAAGRSLPKRATETLQDMVRMGVEPLRLLTALHEDALGIEYTPLPEDPPVNPKKKKAKKAPVLALADESTGSRAIMLGITWHGAPVFERVGELTAQKDGSYTLTGFMLLPWKANRYRGGMERTVRVELQLPAMRKVSDHGHFHLQYPGNPPRLFLPTMVLVEDRVVKQGVVGWLRGLLIGEVNKLIQRPHGGSFDRINGDFNAAIKEGLTKLELSHPVSDLVNGEAMLLHPGPTTTTVEKWAKVERLLELVKDELDVSCTSKGHPGTQAAIASDYGLPRWLLHTNPLARYTERRREPQMRVVKQAQLLADPSPELTVRSSCYPLPPVLAGRFRELTVIIADSNLNLITADGYPVPVAHDTGIVCPSGYRKLELALLTLPCSTPEGRDRLITRLVRNGIAPEQISWEELPLDLGHDLQTVAYRVVVAGPIADAGKVMALVGPYKFVQTVIPEQLYVLIDGELTEVDVILPRYTTVKKSALDAVLYILAGRAGIAEIDPERDLEDLVAEIRRHVPDDGLCPVLNGQGQELGRATAGVLPFYRTDHTSLGLLDFREGEDGVIVHGHEWSMAGIRPRTPKHVRFELKHLLEVHGRLGCLTWAVEDEGVEGDLQEEEIPLPDEGEGYAYSGDE
jgi:hypothetical protein